jgi:hypothetical protein
MDSKPAAQRPAGALGAAVYTVYSKSQLVCVVLSNHVFTLSAAYAMPLLDGHHHQLKPHWMGISISKALLDGHQFLQYLHHTWLCGGIASAHILGTQHCLTCEAVRCALLCQHMLTWPGKAASESTTGPCECLLHLQLHLHTYIVHYGQSFLPDPLPDRCSFILQPSFVKENPLQRG